MMTVTKDATTFVHRWLPSGEAKTRTLLLLHGTGGNEEDLIPLGRSLDPKANLLAPRGKVLEQGMPRFFRRERDGTFDQEDLKRRTDELAAFLSDAAKQYGFDKKRVLAVGFSNGANIASSLMLRKPNALAGAVLFRGMVPFEPAKMPELAGKPVLMRAGRSDPIVPRANSEKLAKILTDCGATVTLEWHAGGHSLAQADVTAAQGWLGKSGL
ncbi:MAG: alpha/beta hydrolase [Gemmatimonadales bacterium]|nr:alpha/beta hydrolase [Gemmatimonadales bacterium]